MFACIHTCFVTSGDKYISAPLSGRIPSFSVGAYSRRHNNLGPLVGFSIHLSIKSPSIYLYQCTLLIHPSHPIPKPGYQSPKSKPPAPFVSLARVILASSPPNCQHSSPSVQPIFPPREYQPTAPLQPFLLPGYAWRRGEGCGVCGCWAGGVGVVGGGMRGEEVNGYKARGMNGRCKPPCFES